MGKGLTRHQLALEWAKREGWREIKENDYKDEYKGYRVFRNPEIEPRVSYLKPICLWVGRRGGIRVGVTLALSYSIIDHIDWDAVRQAHGRQ